MKNTSINIAQKLTDKLLSDQKLLLVDDNPVNISVAKTFLLKWGAKVDIAVNGAEALKLYQQTNYDGILMDLHMPVMSGLEASLKIREYEQNKNAAIHCPIIAFTADVFIKDEVLSENGIDDRLDKPFKPESLHRVLLKNLSPFQEKPNKSTASKSAGNF